MNSSLSSSMASQVRRNSSSNSPNKSNRPNSTKNHPSFSRKDDDDSSASVKSNSKPSKRKKDKTKISVQLNSALEQTAALMMDSMKPFSKAFYREVSALAEMTEADTKQQREQMQLRVCTYKTLPKPIQTFSQAGFDPHLLEEIKANDFSEPTAIQAQTIPLALSGYDLVGVSSSGTGKTLAYLLPLIVHIVHQPQLHPYEGPTGIILAPTSSLVNLIAEQARRYGSIYNMKITAVGRGATTEIMKCIEECPELVITTPDHMTEFLHMRSTCLSRCSIAVIDNVDVLVDDMNSAFQLRTIINYMRGGGNKQVLMFGAAWTPTIESFAKETLNADFVRVIAGNVDEFRSAVQADLEKDKEMEVLKPIPFKDKEHARKLRRHLLSIYLNQIKRRNNLSTMKAFLRWSRELPLSQKCEEVSKQLKERNGMTESIRSSYLRDVVSIKHYLDQINRVDLQNPASVASMKESLKELHTVPSVDLREVIDNVKRNINQSSTQLRDNLIDAGLLDPSTCKTLNPWEQSRSYRRLLRQRGAPSYQYPDAGGESVTVKAPSNYKLFVRHCSQCIGIMQLVKSWNLEIEVAMRQSADFQIADAQISEFKKLIANLTAMVESSEKEIMRLNVKNTELEVANAWFDKWSYIKESAEREEVINEQKRVLSNIAGMANADIESTAYNYALRVEARNQRHEELVRELKTQLKKERLENESLARSRQLLSTQLRTAEINLQNKSNEFDFLTRQREQDLASYQQLEAKLEHMTTTNAELQAALDLKEAQYDELRTESASKIDALTQQLSDVTAEYNAKGAEVDALRDDLRSKKQLIANYSKEIASIKTQLKESIANASKLAEQLSFVPKEKRRRNFKVISICILACIRLTRGANTQGQYFNIVTRRQLESANEVIGELNKKVVLLVDDIGSLENTNQEISNDREEVRGNLRRSMIAIKDGQVVEASLRETIEQRDAQIKAIFNEMYANKAQNSATVTAQQQFYHETIIEYGKIITHGKILSQLQRSMANFLAHSLFEVRSVVHTLDIENQIKQLNNKAMNPVINSSAEVTRQRRKLDLQSIFRNKGNALINWMTVNRSMSRMNPFQLPIHMQNIIYSEKKLLSVRTEYFAEDRQDGRGAANIFANPELRHVLGKDFINIYKMRAAAMYDIRQVDRYVFFLRNKQIELQERIKFLEGKEAELNQLKQQLANRSVVSRGSSEKNKPITSIKASFAHMLDSNDMTGYLSNVIAAIENVQSEHGHMFGDDDTIQSSRSGKSHAKHRKKRRNRPLLQKSMMMSSPGDIPEESSEVSENSKETSNDQSVPRTNNRRNMPLTRSSLNMMGFIPPTISETSGNEGIAMSGVNSYTATTTSSISKLADAFPLYTVQSEDTHDHETQFISSPSPTQILSPSLSSVVVGKTRTGSIMMQRIEEKSEDTVREEGSLASLPPKKEDGLVSQHGSQVLLASAQSSMVLPDIVELDTSSSAPFKKERSPRHIDKSPVHKPVESAALLKQQQDSTDSTNLPAQQSSQRKQKSSLPVQSPFAAAAAAALAAVESSATVATYDPADNGADKVDTAVIADIASSVLTVDSVQQEEAPPPRKQRPSRRSSAIPGSIMMQASGSSDSADLGAFITPHTAIQLSELASGLAIQSSQALSPPNPVSAIQSPSTSPLPAKKQRNTVLRRPSNPQVVGDAVSSVVTAKAHSFNETGVSTQSSSFKKSRPSSPTYAGTFISSSFDDHEMLDNAEGGEGEGGEDGEEYYYEDEEEEEEEAYMQELEIVKMEAMAMLRRDNDLNAKIKTLGDANTELQSKSISLSRDLHALRASHNKLDKDYERLCEEMEKVGSAYEHIQRQNALLRGSVEDGYRYHSSEVDRILTAKEQEEYERSLRLIRPKGVDQGTQIACSVCAIRDTLTASDGVCGFITPNNNNDPQQLDYDDDTVPTVHRGLAMALEGEVVLTGKPRRISDNTRDFSAERSRRRSPSPTSPKRMTSASGATSTANNAQTMTGASNSLRPPRPHSSSDKLFQHRAESEGIYGNGNYPSNSGGGGLHGSKSSGAIAGRPQSASPYLNNSQSTSNMLPTDQSKFSKMKKMPLKTNTLVSAQPMQPVQQPQQVLGASSQRTKIMPRNDHVSRTLTNTAAYLQNKIVEDHMRNNNNNAITDVIPKRSYSANAAHGSRGETRGSGYNNRDSGAMTDEWSDDEDDVKRIANY